MPPPAALPWNIILTFRSPKFEQLLNTGECSRGFLVNALILRVPGEIFVRAREMSGNFDTTTSRVKMAHSGFLLFPVITKIRRELND